MFDRGLTGLDNWLQQENSREAGLDWIIGSTINFDWICF
jgi:hypothetical protein